MLRRTKWSVDKVDQHAAVASGQNVAQVSNLLYRRFPIGRASEVRERVWIRGVRRLEALRHSRLGNLRYDFVNGPDETDRKAGFWLFNSPPIRSIAMQ